jgi:Zn ribbon nucleic-acid-binding protein
MVIQTANPFAPAIPRVPVTPRRLHPGYTGPEKTPKVNKVYCPKCTARLTVNYDESECLNCGYVDHQYIGLVKKSKNTHSVIGTGTRFIIRYIGDFETLHDTVTHVKVYRVRNRVTYGVRCPFCGDSMNQSSLSGRKKEIREERYKCVSGHRISLAPNGKGDIGWR